VVPGQGDSVAMYATQDRSWTHFKAQVSLKEEGGKEGEGRGKWVME